MSYLDDILAATSAHNAGIKRNRESLNQLVSLAAARKVAEQAASMSAPSAAPVSASVPAASGGHSTKGGFDPDFDSRLNRLLKDFGGKVKINSGYRSPERQAQLYAAAVKKYGSEAAARKWVAPPGHSNHNKGLAADLGFNNAATIAAVHAAASKYGLIFPLANENWHIEPIGIRK